jgi:hypothetical protein
LCGCGPGRAARDGFGFGFGFGACAAPEVCLGFAGGGATTAPGVWPLDSSTQWGSDFGAVACASAGLTRAASTLGEANFETHTGAGRIEWE